MKDRLRMKVVVRLLEQENVPIPENNPGSWRSEAGYDLLILLLAALFFGVVAYSYCDMMI